MIFYRRFVIGLRSGRGRVFLIGSACNDFQHIIRQWPLQRLRFLPRLDGTSICFDIVVRIVRPETDSTSGAPAAAVIRRAETGGWNFIRRGGFWYSGAVCFI